jgi:translation initiation factor 2 beta subunit (eIF-2beta)/eIF-5
MQPDVQPTLRGMFESQRSFMELLQAKRGFPQFPVDIKSRDGQRLLHDTAHYAMDELHEAMQHLKNSKAHRATEVRELDRQKYVEELVDHVHYFVELCILSGITDDELYDAYIAKHAVNVQRVHEGY